MKDTRPKLTNPTIGTRRGNIYSACSSLTLIMLLPTFLMMLIAPSIGYPMFFAWLAFNIAGALVKIYPHIIYSFKVGWKGTFFLPLTALITQLGKYLLAKLDIDFLNWKVSGGILGGLSTTGAGLELGMIGEIITVIFALIFLFGFIGLVIPVCNFYEEYYFRKRWIYVPIWAILHLFLGFSGVTIGSLFIIFILGIIFKLIWDKYGFQTAFITHLGTNYCSILIALLLEFVF